MTKIPSNFQWSKFAGLASQWAVALIILMYLGKYFDQYWLSPKAKPMFVWMLPFIFILLSLFKIIRDTQSKK